MSWVRRESLAEAGVAMAVVVMVKAKEASVVLTSRVVVLVSASVVGLVRREINSTAAVVAVMVKV